MGNTWTGMYYTAIAQKALQIFMKKLLPIGSFTTDFSEDIKDQGTSVDVTLIPAASAASDLQDDHSGKRSTAAGNTTTTKRTVTLDQQPIVGFHLTDEEAHKIATGKWDDTRSKLIETKINALGQHIVNYVINLITAANFSSVAHTGLAANFDLDDVIDISTALGAADWPMDSGLVSMALQWAYLGNLKKDNAVQDASASGLDVVKSGMIKQVDAFNLFPCSSIPPSGGTPESENLVGWVCKPEAIAIAMRQVQAQATDRLEHYEVLQDPNTGVLMVYRAWYDPDYGKINHTFECLYGASKGYTTALQRIRSAA